MWCPIHPISEDLNEGRDVADDAFIGPLFQSWIGDGKNVCVGLELSFMSSRAAIAGCKKCSRIHIDKSVYVIMIVYTMLILSDVYDCVHNADSV